MIASLFYNPTFQARVGTSAIIASLVCAAVLAVWAYIAKKKNKKRPPLFWYLSATAIGLLLFGVVCSVLTPSPLL